MNACISLAVNPDQTGAALTLQEEDKMTPETTPQASLNSPISPAIDLDNEYPVGLEAAEPDELGAWWLDLGCVGLPSDLAV